MIGRALRHNLDVDLGSYPTPTRSKSVKQVLNPGSCVEAAGCRPVECDHVSVIWDNRKLLLFPLGEVPEMTRGRGVILQKYKDGGLSDAKTFNRKEGLTWAAGAGRVRTETDLRAWIGKRAQIGRAHV